MISPISVVAAPVTGVPGGGSALSARSGKDALAGRAAMLHPRGQFLADIAALVEGDAMQFVQPGIQREDLVAAEIAAFRHAQRQPLGMIGGRAFQKIAASRRRRRCCAAPKRREPGIGEGDGAFGRPPGQARHRPQAAGAASISDLGAQAVHREPLDQRLGLVRGAIQQQRAVAFGHQEIEQDLALGRQQGGIKPASRAPARSRRW